MSNSVNELYNTLIRSQTDIGKTHDEGEKYACTFIKNFLIRICYQNKAIEDQVITRTKLLRNTLRPLDEVLLERLNCPEDVKKA